MKNPYTQLHNQQPDLHVDPGLQTLRKKIRLGSEPDNPALVHLWLTIDLPESAEHSGAILREHYEQQFRLLLDTIADELVPRHWRRWCLDNIYKPLSSLQKLADDDASNRQLARLCNELSVISRYVQHSLNS